MGYKSPTGAEVYCRSFLKMKTTLRKLSQHSLDPYVGF